MAIINKYKDTTGAGSEILAKGELASNTVDGTLYVGDGVANVLLVDTGAEVLPSGTAQQTLRNSAGTWEATNSMLINSAGNVGIGTTPVTNRQLAVESDQTGLQMLVRSTDTEAGIAFAASGSSNTFGTRVGCQADDMTLTTNGSERMRIDSSGNVGIGTDNPTSVLTVEKDTASLAKFSRSSDVEVTVGGSLQVPTVTLTKDTGNVCIGSRAPDTMSFHLGSATASAASERMRINSTGTFVESGYNALDFVAGTANMAGTARIYRTISLSQSDYNGLTPDANTLYIIV